MTTVQSETFNTVLVLHQDSTTTLFLA